VLYMETTYIFISYLTHFFLELEIFQTKVVEKVKAHILCSVTFFGNLAAYDIIMCKHTVERGGPQMTIWCIRIACWIPKATNKYTH
jgi:hypothetical protein